MSERGIFKVINEVSGETFYRVEYKHRGKIIVRGGDFLTLEEAVKFRDNQMDQQNIKKILLLDRSIRFIAEFYDSGKAYRKSFKTFSDAVAWRRDKRLRKQIGKIQLGKLMTVREFSHYWFNNEVKVIRSKSTQSSYKRILSRHINQHIGDLVISEVKTHHINELMAKLKQNGLSISSIELVLSILQRCLEFACLNDVIIKNPLRGMDKVRGQKQEANFWEKDDLKKFFAYISNKPTFALYYTAAKTGMRKGELAGLKWKDICFERDVIKVSATRTNNDFKTETKSKKIRRIPLASDLKEILINYKEKIRNKFNEVKESDYIFLNKKGVPISYHSINPLFYQYQKEAKVSRLISIHGLRHSFASHFSMQNGRMELLQAIMGHSDFKTTERYRHFSVEYLQGAKEVIERNEL